MVGAADERKFDLIAMGRAAVDFYGEQVGARLEDMTSFAKYLGGSAANTAVGSARLGLRVAMLTRVGDEHMGRFLRETFIAEGVNVDHVKTDPQRLTGLVVLGIRDQETFPLIFFRENCADMAIERDDFDAEFIGSAKALLVNGTHFSKRAIDAACRHAMALAKQQRTKIVFDIDYRPVLWGLTSLGLGEDRFVASNRVTAHLQSIVPECDLVIGTEEEFHIAGGTTDTHAALVRLRSLSAATLVLKRGAHGCVVFPGPIPTKIEDGILHLGFPTEVFNILGAGDGFAAGFLSGWLRDADLMECGKLANACGSLVVSRHSCAPAMPSSIELADFLARADQVRRPHDDPNIIHLHRVTTGYRAPTRIFALAFDHRRQFEEFSNNDGGGARIAQFKDLIAQALLKMPPEESGALVDDHHGLNALYRLSGTKRWIARPVEISGSRPLAFESGARLAARLRTWPAEHIVKCLVSYRADDPNPLRTHQESSLIALQDAVFDTGHRWLLEVIPGGYETASDLIGSAVERLYGLGLRPTWWKLPPATSDYAWASVAEAIRRHDPLCGGVVVLGVESTDDELFAAFEAAIRSGVGIGFAVGRSVWRAAAHNWFANRSSPDKVVAEVTTRYRVLLEGWTKLESQLMDRSLS